MPHPPGGPASPNRPVWFAKLTDLKRPFEAWEAVGRDADFPKHEVGCQAD